MKNRRILVLLGCVLALLPALGLSELDAAAEDKADVANQLIQAVKRGDIARARILLEKGSDVNTKLQDGSTPLMWAALPGRPDLVKLLLKNGAEVNARAQDGRDPAQVGSRHGTGRDRPFAQIAWS